MSHHGHDHDHDHDGPGLDDRLADVTGGRAEAVNPGPESGAQDDAHADAAASGLTSGIDAEEEARQREVAERINLGPND